MRPKNLINMVRHLSACKRRLFSLRKWSWSILQRREGGNDVPNPYITTLLVILFSREKSKQRTDEKRIVLIHVKFYFPPPSPPSRVDPPAHHTYILHTLPPQLFLPHFPPHPSTKVANYFNFLNALGATQWSTQCNKSKYHASQSPSPNLAIRSLQALYSFFSEGQCFSQLAFRAGRWSTTSSSSDFWLFCLLLWVCFFWCVCVYLFVCGHYFFS